MFNACSSGFFFCESSCRTTMNYTDILNQSYNNMSCSPFFVEQKNLNDFLLLLYLVCFSSTWRSHMDGFIAHWWQFPKLLTQCMLIYNLMRWGLFCEDLGMFWGIFLYLPQIQVHDPRSRVSMETDLCSQWWRQVAHSSQSWSTIECTIWTV